MYRIGIVGKMKSEFKISESLATSYIADLLWIVGFQKWDKFRKGNVIVLRYVLLVNVT